MKVGSMVVDLSPPRICWRRELTTPELLSYMSGENNQRHRNCCCRRLGDLIARMALLKAAARLTHTT
jgi:hypothetical protein